MGIIVDFNRFEMNETLTKEEGHSLANARHELHLAILLAEKQFDINRGTGLAASIINAMIQATVPRILVQPPQAVGKLEIGSPSIAEFGNEIRPQKARLIAQHLSKIFAAGYLDVPVIFKDYQGAEAYRAIKSQQKPDHLLQLMPGYPTEHNPELESLRLFNRAIHTLLVHDIASAVSGNIFYIDANQN